MSPKHYIPLGLLVVLFIATVIYERSDQNETLPAIDPANKELVSLGKDIYAANCASCHGANFEGETPNWRSMKANGTLPAPPHDGSGHTWHHGDAHLFNYTKFGGQAMSGPNFKSAMPAFGDQLSDHEIIASLAYIKTSWNLQQRSRQLAISEQERN